MNIQILNLPKLNNRTQQSSIVAGQNNISNNNVTYPNLKPLACDTVSFGSKAKIVNDVKKASKNKLFKDWDPDNELTLDNVIKLCKSFKKPLMKFDWDLKQALKPITCTESNPEGIVMPGKRGIHSRVKDAIKLLRKGNKRGIKTIKELGKIGDAGGTRITLRTASTQDTAQLFHYMKDMIKKGYKVKEIENYRPTPKDSYVSGKTLEDFESYCVKHGQYPEVTSKPLSNSYTAIHISFELPDGKVIELQIMGRDVENYKEVEDLFYKYRCNEDFSDEYKPIEKMFKKLMPKLDDFQKETLERYHKDSYEHARHIPPRSAKIRFAPERDFLPWPYSLPPELNPVNLYYKMIECKKVAVNAKPKQ